VHTDRLGRLWLIQRDGVRDGWTYAIEVALPPDGPDDCRAAPQCELRSEGANPS
jgi:hypothetical protein